MANQVMNIARGKAAYYAGLPAASDAILIVILEATEADDVLNNYDDLSALLGAAGNTEATSTGYVRGTADGVVASVDDTANTAKIVATDETFAAISQAAAEVWAKLLMCYDDDTGAGTDANIIPLTHHDFVVTPNGGDIVADFDATNGWWGSA